MHCCQPLSCPSWRLLRLQQQQQQPVWPPPLLPARPSAFWRTRGSLQRRRGVCKRLIGRTGMGRSCRAAKVAARRQRHCVCSSQTKWQMTHLQDPPMHQRHSQKLAAFQVNHSSTLLALVAVCKQYIECSTHRSWPHSRWTPAAQPPHTSQYKATNSLNAFSGTHRSSLRSRWTTAARPPAPVCAA